ncbi:MAG: CopD family protein, partial [Clostridia bacterium]|nr:CopD family protein [Clostridia bacterium]
MGVLTGLPARRTAVLAAAAAAGALADTVVTSAFLGVLPGFGGSAGATAGLVLGTPFGWTRLTRLLLGLALALSWLRRPAAEQPTTAFGRRDLDGPPRVRGRAVGGRAVGLTATVLAALTTFSLSSHAVATRQPWLSVALHFIHLAAAAAWLGGLWALAHLLRRPPAEEGEAAATAALLRRFSDVGLAAVAVVTVTGLYAAYNGLYGAEALTRSAYGQTLLVKHGAFLAMLLVAGANFFRSWLADLCPARRRQILARAHRTVRLEAALGAVVLAAAAALSVTPPADAPAGVAPQERQLPLGPDVQARLFLAPEPDGRVEFRLTGPPAGSTVSLQLSMDEHTMAPFSVALRPSGQGGLAAVVALPMAGQWRATVHVELPDGSERQAATSFAAEAVPGNPRASVLAFRALRADPWRPAALTAALAVAAVSTTAAVAVARRRQVRPLVLLAAVPLALAVRLVYGALAIEAFPTTFTRNPLPADDTVTGTGAARYAAYCAGCHGDSGTGRAGGQPVGAGGGGTGG